MMKASSLLCASLLFALGCSGSDSNVDGGSDGSMNPTDSSTNKDSSMNTDSGGMDSSMNMDSSMQNDGGLNDGSLNITCTKPSDCNDGGNANVCCASIALGQGMLPNCPVNNVTTSCKTAQACPSMVQFMCNTTQQLRACAMNADCTENGYTSCCTFMNGMQKYSACFSKQLGMQLGASCQ